MLTFGVSCRERNLSGRIRIARIRGEQQWALSAKRGDRCHGDELVARSLEPKASRPKASLPAGDLSLPTCGIMLAIERPGFHCQL
jgi:hypothetical protein